VIDFDGQAVVVTGAGRGLGRLYAIDLARRGVAVVVNDLGSSMDGIGSDRRVAEQVVEEIEAAGGVAVASHESVATREGGRAIVESALDRFGRLDAVVSNAGIFQTTPFDQITADDWRRMIEVHLDGGFHLSQPAFRAMKAQGYGRFVFVASSAGLFGQLETAHYAAAKAGLVGLTNVIALEGAEHGISANSVLPFGYSRMVTETVGDIEQIPEAAAFLSAIDPDLVVPMVVFLASRNCRLTHHNFSAGAGRFARVFTALGEGWLAPRPSGAKPTAEDVEDHLDAIGALEPFTVPMSIYDEVGEIWSRLEVNPEREDRLW
jgi:NAD(P)-dependent dehydrogenase (short-subunit alcohol dehydrogenase family)